MKYTQARAYTCSNSHHVKAQDTPLYTYDVREQRNLEKYMYSAVSRMHVMSTYMYMCTCVMAYPHLACVIFVRTRCVVARTLPQAHLCSFTASVLINIAYW